MFSCLTAAIFMIAAGSQDLSTADLIEDNAKQGAESFKRGDYASAITALTKAVQINPSDSISFVNLGNALYKTKKFPEAISNLTRAIIMDPNEPAAFNIRGLAYRAVGNTTNAIADFSAGLRLDPRNPRLLTNRALAYSHLRDFSAALSDVDQAISIAPDKELVFLTRGGIQVKRGKWTEAVADFRRAIQLGPTNAVACNDLAWILATAPDAWVRNGKESLTNAKKACQITDFKQPYFVGTLAAAYAELGDFQEAAAFQKQALQMLPADDKERANSEARLVLYSKHLPYRSNDNAAK
jgi:tetratricopeptide (TPR) repeat protein